MAKKAAVVSATSLAAIVAATKSNTIVYVDPAEVDALVKDGLVETNPAMEENGKIAARATAKGLSQIEGEGAAAAGGDDAPRYVRAAPADLSIFTAKRPGGGRPDVYPFDELTPPNADGTPTEGGVIFVPATDKMPEPHKSLSSTVSAANRRYAREVGTEEYKAKNGETKTRAVLEYDRKFKVIAGENNGVPGAWLGRIK